MVNPSTILIPSGFDKNYTTIIHHSWKTATLPTQFQKWSDSWLIHNPGFKRIIWTDDDNRNLIAFHYPWFLSTYDTLPVNIQRIDAARIFYLHRFGGIYSDLDVECLTSVSPLLESNEVILGRMGPDTDYEHSIPNAIMMARRPGHDFWMWCAHYIMANRDNVWETSVEGTAGPIMLYTVYDEYMKSRQNLLGIGGGHDHHHQEEDDDYMPNGGSSNSIYIAPPSAFYSYSWHHDHKLRKICSIVSPNFNGQTCVAKMANRISGNETMYAISYWSHSWDGGFQGGEEKTS